MRYFSTFSGIGGFELGITQAYVDAVTRSTERGSQKNTQGNKRQGFQSKEVEDIATKNRWTSQHDRDIADKGQPTCVGYSEIDKYATTIYQKHFPEHKNYGDITAINADELPDFELLVGGFPCQSFSIAGKRRGFEDTRGTMFFELARILRTKQPKLFVFENVKGLLSHDNGQTFATIISTITELGYDCQWQVLNSKNHGVPQNRERVFIVGHLRGTTRPKVFPLTEGDTNHIVQLNQPTHSNDRVYSSEGVSPTLNTAQGGRRQPKIAPTIRANHHNTADVHFIPEGCAIRRLTPLECERLQGFPDGWTEGVSDTQRYKTLGNAVTVNVVKALFSEIIKEWI